MKTKSKIFFLCFLFLSLFFSLSLAHAWVEPTTIPPGNNIYAPLNSSAFGQSKVGGLILNLGNAAHGLIVRYGLVGIGTDNPESKLDVRGETRTDSLGVRGNANISGSATVTGSVSSVGNIATSSNVCINGDCRSSWPAVAPSTTDTLQSVTARGNATDREMVKNNDWGMWLGGTNTNDRVRVGELWGQGGIFAGSGKDLLLGSDTGWARAQNFSTSGNVGIGTNGPVSKLDVRGKVLFTRDGVGECCGNDATLSLGESTYTTGRRASISFHNAGRHEGTFDLAPDGERRFRMYDNQGARMGLETTGNVRVGDHLCIRGDCRPTWSEPRRHCFWMRLETHWMAACPDGYHVDGMALTNASAGCWEAGCQGGQSSWVTAGGFLCCND